MGQIGIKLRRRNSDLDLNDLSATGIYRIAEGFVPPPVNLIPNLAEGTSANRWSGADLVTIKGANRRWSFQVNVGGASEAEITNGIRRLDHFLRSGTMDDPVFLHYRASIDASFEPLWGQHGADRRYEIAFGQAAASEAYPLGVTPNQILPECTVELEVKPVAIGKRQKLAHALGGIQEDILGWVDGNSRGTMIPEGTVNEFGNPIFGDATFLNDWVKGTNIDADENRDRKFILFGESSARLTARAGTLNTFVDPLNTVNTNTWTLTGYVRLPDDAVPTSADLELYYVSAQTTTFTQVGDGAWYRMEAQITGINGLQNTGVIVKEDRTVYVDGFQLEEKVYATPLCHGELLGCHWAGDPHNGPSEREEAWVKTVVRSYGCKKSPTISVSNTDLKEACLEETGPILCALLLRNNPISSPLLGRLI